MIFTRNFGALRAVRVPDNRSGHKTASEVGLQAQKTSPATAPTGTERPEDKQPVAV